MSAFVVDLEHINVMIWAGLQYANNGGPMSWYWDNPTRQGRLDYQNASEIGQMLLDANVDSVDHRYDETNEREVYTYKRPQDVEWSTGELLNAIHGFEYQACETPDWTKGEAHAFCRALEHRLIRRVAGYESGPWEITPGKQSLASRKPARV